MRNNFPSEDIRKQIFEAAKIFFSTYQASKYSRHYQPWGYSVLRVKLRETETLILLDSASHLLKEERQYMPSGKDDSIHVKRGITEYGEVVVVRREYQIFQIDHPIGSHAAKSAGLLLGEIRVFFEKGDSKNYQIFVDAGQDLYSYLCEKNTHRHDFDKGLLALKLILAVCKLHQLGYVHLDLKPENICIDLLNFVRLIDMESARLMNSEYQYDSFGTTPWLPPDILSWLYSATSYDTPFNIWEKLDCFALKRILGKVKEGYDAKENLFTAYYGYNPLDGTLSSVDQLLMTIFDDKEIEKNDLKDILDTRSKYENGMWKHPTCKETPFELAQKIASKLYGVTLENLEMLSQLVHDLSGTPKQPLDVSVTDVGLFMHLKPPETVQTVSSEFQIGGAQS